MAANNVLKIVKPKRKTLSNLLCALVGWPPIDIEHDKAVEAIRRFMFIGELLLIYQPNSESEHVMPPTKWFTNLSITIDIFTLTLVTRLICCTFTNDLSTLAYLGDIFVGMRNEYALRVLAVCGVICLGSCRAVSCYLIRNGSLDWTKVMNKAMINGWKPEVLDMKELYCLKWKQFSVFIARQVVGSSLIITLVWITCYAYLVINCKTLYSAAQSPLALSCFVTWQVITLISVIWFVPQVAWNGFLYGIAFLYVINRSDSIYSDLQASLKSKSLPSSALRKLYNQNISFLNEFDYINRSIRYIGYSCYNFVSVAGQVAMLYSYFRIFGMPLADLGLGLIGFNTIFQIGLSSFLAGKSVAKVSIKHYLKNHIQDINMIMRMSNIIETHYENWM